MFLLDSWRICAGQRIEEKRRATMWTQSSLTRAVRKMVSGIAVPARKMVRVGVCGSGQPVQIYRTVAMFYDEIYLEDSWLRSMGVGGVQRRRGRWFKAVGGIRSGFVPKQLVAMGCSWLMVVLVWISVGIPYKRATICSLTSIRHDRDQGAEYWEGMSMCSFRPE
ncbi:hypothetical protein F5146DRAFT_1004239 [Armillaria mellea]|nr:hypothetical protein F5146DRAFT_1004239 [Armillaria mellea]